jgi:sulfur relay (sulfurtransferase) DsrC/TusE family protein
MAMVLIIVLTTFYLFYTGYSYYSTPLEERFYHPRHNWFKPSGVFGQGLGIIGTIMIAFGVSIYIARKRYNFLSKYIRLKYLLEFHIFLCTLGPILILFHTAFKFGGIVSIAFWSMVAVVLSGVIGRFIYIQIPRTIEGRALSLNEVKHMKTDVTSLLSEKYNLDSDIIELIVSYTNVEKSSGNYKTTRSLRKELKSINLPKEDRVPIVKMVKNEMSLSRKIGRLETMQKLFKYWHVAHMPFALIMLVIVVIHVSVTLAFGYKWIF